MKKIVMVLMLCLVPFISFASEDIILPYDVIVSDPLTDKSEAMTVTVTFNNDNKHYAILKYRVMNNTRTGVLFENSFRVYDVPDNPESITANCLDVGNPWTLCTGAGTCDNDCDESTTDMTDYMGSFWSTFHSRTLTLMNQDNQARRATQAKP